MLKNYSAPDDAHKEMPIENVVIMFHQQLTSLWNKTILSNYEFEMVTDWIEYWFNLRSHICTMANDYCECLTKAESPKLKESAIVLCPPPHPKNVETFAYSILYSGGSACSILQ